MPRRISTRRRMGTFRQVVLPLLAPSILAGFLLAFTFSFEDFIIAYFVAGPDTTLPIYIFSSIRRGVTPEINAVGSVVLLTSFVLLIIAQAVLRRGERMRTAHRKGPGHAAGAPVCPAASRYCRTGDPKVTSQRLVGVALDAEVRSR